MVVQPVVEEVCVPEKGAIAASLIESLGYLLGYREVGKSAREFDDV